MYLEVKFHDNDFYNEFVGALKALWEICPNYERLMKFHNEGKLVMMINRLITTEYIRTLIWRVLNTTSNTRELDSLLDITKTTKRYSEYFDIRLEFHETDEFTKEWHNSEHFYLDLTTGTISSF